MARTIQTARKCVYPSQQMLDAKLKAWLKWCQEKKVDSEDGDTAGSEDNAGKGSGAQDPNKPGTSKQ